MIGLVGRDAAARGRADMSLRGSACRQGRVRRVRRLLVERDQWELLCEQPHRIGDAVDEIARFETPSRGLLRVTTQDVRLGDTDLSAGSEVLLLFASANRDHQLCERPEVFDGGGRSSG
jgi:hypothetical protein